MSTAISSGVQERFQERVGAPDSNGCLPWLGRLTQGYGYFNNTTVHRFAYALANGPFPDVPWTERLDVHHTCGNAACVNPAHLEALTRAEHRRRHTSARGSRDG